MSSGSRSRSHVATVEQVSIGQYKWYVWDTRHTPPRAVDSDVEPSRGAAVVVGQSRAVELNTQAKLSLLAPSLVEGTPGDGETPTKADFPRYVLSVVDRVANLEGTPLELSRDELVAGLYALAEVANRVDEARQLDNYCLTALVNIL